MSTPPERFESGQKTQKDAMHALRAQLDQLEKRGKGDPRVVEAVRSTRSKLDHLQTSLDDVHELEGTAERLQHEIDQLSKENKKIEATLPPEAVSSLKSAPSSTPKITPKVAPSVPKAAPTVSPTRTPEKTPDTLRVALGGTLMLDGQQYVMPKDGSHYARRTFSAVRQGNEWIVRKRSSPTKTVASAPVKKSIMDDPTLISPFTVQVEKPQPIHTLEKTPDLTLRVALGGTLMLDGQQYVMPKDGSHYARRTFSAVRQGNEWIVRKRTARSASIPEATGKSRGVSYDDLKKPKTVPTTTPKTSPKPTTRSAPPAEPIGKSRGVSSFDEEKPVSIPKATQKPVGIVQTPLMPEKKVDAVVVPQAAEMSENIKVPEQLRARFEKLDNAYRSIYARVSSPAYKLKYESRLYRLSEEERPKAAAAINDAKQRIANAVLTEWKRMRDSYASASPNVQRSASNVKNIPPQLFALWSEKYRKAPNDADRAQMLIDDASAMEFPLLNEEQLQDLIIAHTLFQDTFTRDGADKQTKSLSKYVVKYVDGTESTHDYDPIYEHMIRSMMNLDDVSKESDDMRKRLGESIGKKISVKPINGLNQHVLDWMLNAQNSAQPVTGIPAGMEVSFSDLDSAVVPVAFEKIKVVSPEQPTAWIPTPEKGRTWQQHSHQLVDADSRLRKQFESHEKEAVRNLCTRFRDTTRPYWKVYTEAMKQKNPDEKLIQTTLNQIEVAIHYYGEEMEKVAKGVSAPSSMLEDEGAGQSQLARMLFYRGQSADDIRDTLTTVSNLRQFRTLTDEQVRSLLHLKAHLPDLAGKDGKLNWADIDGLADRLVADRMAHPDALYQEILKDQNIDPESEEAGGIRLALGIEELTQAEKNKLSRGKTIRSIPFVGDSIVGAEGVRKIKGMAKVEELRKDIPVKLRERIVQELQSFLTKGQISKNAGRDAGHGEVSEADLLAVDTYAKALKTISSSNLKAIVDATGATIDTHAPGGLSVQTVDWMLDANARPYGRPGVPPGSVFRIDQKTAPSVIAPTAVPPLKSRSVETPARTTTPKTTSTIEEKATPTPIETSANDKGFTTIKSRPKVEVASNQPTKAQNIAPPPPPETPVASTEVASTGKVLEITSDEQFTREVLQSESPVIVDFTATWCQPCRDMKPNLEAAAKSRKIVSVDVDRFPVIAQRYKLTGLPTLMVLEAGKEMHRKTGLQSQQAIEKMTPAHPTVDNIASRE